MSFDLEDMPYPPTHPRGQHRMEPVEQLAAYSQVEVVDVLAALDDLAAVFADRRQQTAVDLGLNPDKFVAMNRAERRAVARDARRNRP